MITVKIDHGNKMRPLYVVALFSMLLSFCLFLPSFAHAQGYLVQDTQGDASLSDIADATDAILGDESTLVFDANYLNQFLFPQLENVIQSGFFQTANAIQLNAEETKNVLEGVSQAIMDSNKAVAQTASAAERQATATMPQLSTGCTVASAVQKRNASGSAADSAASGYVLIAQREGTGAYGAVPDNSSTVAYANRLCGRVGDNYTFIPNHGPSTGQLVCK